MSDKEESAPVANPAAAPADSDNTKTEATTASVEDPKVEDLQIAAPAEKSEKAEKPAESEMAKEEATKPVEEPSEKPTETEPAKTDDADIEMKDAPEAEAQAEGASKNEKAGATEAVVPAVAATPKSKAPPRRKSTAGTDKKTLNKKASKAQILHTDAKPGDHYFIKLKGFPQWPCIICDEDMLPQAILKTRPVSAARADGEYREDFADGGKNVANRTFPIMYLATNEFGWVSNKDLIDLDPTKVMEQVNSKMRAKDLVLAHQLAEEDHDLDYYKGVLNQFQEELLERQKAAEAKAAAAATPKKKKGKASADEDIEMEDADSEVNAKKDKKRKNPEDSETPQRSDSIKKPKIKLTHNSTPKANGGSSKASKTGEAKSSKKAKKPKEESEERVQTPAAPELSAGEKFDRKKKEVLFLRHKLQKGLLTRDQQPKEDEMRMMSEYLLKLEGFPDLETDIIKTTKINKVLKAMLKLDNIPKEEEFEFKPRSQVLLDKWNKLLAQDVQPQSPPHENNYNFKSADEPKSEAAELDSEPAEPKAKSKAAAKSDTNGVKKTNTEEAKAAKADVEEAEESKDASKKEESSGEKVTAKKDEVASNEEKPKGGEETKPSEAVDVAA